MHKKLKILIVAPSNFKVTDHNETNSGSIEQFTYVLSEALAKRGHKVTLFATKDVRAPPKVKLKYLFQNPPGNYYKLSQDKVWSRDRRHVSAALRLSAGFDYISCHTMAGIPLIEKLKHQSPTPAGSTTIHWRHTDMRLKPLLKSYTKHPLIVISKKAQKALRHNHILGLISNGLKLSQWPFCLKKEGYLLFVGKIIPEKGVDLAVKAAKTLKMKLVIAGRKIDERNPDFFRKKILPHLDNEIRYVGEIIGVKKVDIFKRAYAFLGPGRWADTFGTVFLEAQACGTPVIAWNPGASNDAIIEGKTGYIIKASNDKQALKQLCEKINVIKNIDKKDCRLNIEQNFTIEKVAQKYEEVMYEQIKNRR